MDREAPAQGRTFGHVLTNVRLRQKLAHNLVAYAFLAPMLLLFALFSWYPMVRGFVMSFQRTNLLDSTWIGLRNYQVVLTLPELRQAWITTAWWVVLTTVATFPIPILLGVVLNEIRHWRGLFRFGFYLPAVLPPIVSMLLWKWFYDPGPGLANTVLGLFHLPPSQWLQSPSTAMPSLALFAAWGSMGGSALFYLAAVAAIAPELYEAAELDGAGLFRRFRHVTLPQLRFIVMLMLLMHIISSVQMFNESFIMTSGGPGNATQTVMLMIYRYAFQYSQYGIASALGVVMFLVLLVISLAYLRLNRRLYAY